MRGVCRKPVFFFWLISIAGSFLAFMIWSPNYRLFIDAARSQNIDSFEFLNILVFSLADFSTSFTLSDRIIMVMISLLVGLNGSLVVLYFKERARLQKIAGGSFIGMMIGVLGIGCSSCGSILFASFLGVGASTGLMNFLPLHGLEFSLVSILILIATIVYIATKIDRPNVCPVKRRR